MKKSLKVIITFAVILLAVVLIVGPGEKEEDDDVLSISVVASSSFSDRDFFESAKAGTDRLKEDKDVEVKYIECNEEDIAQALMNAAKESDFVVAVGWRCYEIASIATDFIADTKFIWVDNLAEGLDTIDNLVCITYDQNEGSFLAGYVAAKSSKTGVVGVIGGEESVVVKDFVVGYTQGAKYANKKVKVLVDYTGSFTDKELSKAAALDMNSKKADVVFNVAGASGEGIFQAAKEKGFYAIGVDSDQKLSNPEYEDVILCSMKKDVGASIYDFIVEYMNTGVFEGGKELKTTLTDGYVSIAYGDEESTQLVSEELKSKVEIVKKKIINGDIKVKSAK